MYPHVDAPRSWLFSIRRVWVGLFAKSRDLGYKCLSQVYKKEGNIVPEFHGTLGESFAQLAHTVCKLWHVQEKVYEFESVPVDEKDGVIKELAIVNLERNQCIDGLDQRFRELIEAARAAG